MHSVHLWVYNFGIRLYGFSILCASFFNKKAEFWIEGRRNWKPRLLTGPSVTGKRIWIHCASLGEFEQARPFIETIKTESPCPVIILSFFSPSGYEIKKDYPQADIITYLP